MRGRYAMSSAQYPIDEDPRDEGPLADLVSAGMWTTAGLLGAAMFALPGSPHAHLAEGLAVAGAAVAWGLISLVLYLLAIGLSFVNSWISLALYFLVAMIWFIPDRRFEH